MDPSDGPGLTPLQGLAIALALGIVAWLFVGWMIRGLTGWWVW